MREIEHFKRKKNLLWLGILTVIAEESSNTVYLDFSKLVAMPHYGQCGKMRPFFMLLVLQLVYVI
jgi:hypothetical protein